MSKNSLRVSGVLVVLVNLGYIAWVIYLSGIMNGDKIYVVFLFWTLIVIFFNLLIAGLVQFLYKAGARLPLWFCVVEILSLFVLPFLI